MYDSSKKPSEACLIHSFILQFSDVNAFLTLAATRHTLLPEELRENPQVNEIVSAARSGHVPVRLVSSKSIHFWCLFQLMSLLQTFRKRTRWKLSHTTQQPCPY